MEPLQPSKCPLARLYVREAVASYHSSGLSFCVRDQQIVLDLKWDGRAHKIVQKTRRSEA